MACCGDDAGESGNSPGTKWVAFNSIADHLDCGRRTRPGATRYSAPLRTPGSSGERSSWSARP